MKTYDIDENHKHGDDYKPKKDWPKLSLMGNYRLHRKEILERKHGANSEFSYFIGTPPPARPLRASSGWKVVGIVLLDGLTGKMWLENTEPQKCGCVGRRTVSDAEWREWRMKGNFDPCKK